MGRQITKEQIDTRGQSGYLFQTPTIVELKQGYDSTEIDNKLALKSDITYTDSENSTQNTNIINNTNNITTNTNDITNLQSDNNIQDTKISTNIVNITTNSTDITNLQSDNNIQDTKITTNSANINTNYIDILSLRTDIDLISPDSHTHTNKNELDLISSVGSGSIITTAERTKLNSIEDGAEVNTVTSVNTQTGAVVLTTNNITENTNLYYTETRVSSNPTVTNKADITYVDTQDTNLQTQIDSLPEFTDLNLKADITYVDTQDTSLQTNINLKADITYVDTQDTNLQIQIDSLPEFTDLNLKADITYVDSENSTQTTLINTNITDISNLTTDSHTHTNKPELDNIISNGSGTLFLTDDGSYKPTPGSTISDTDDLNEGLLNLYYTDTRVDDNFSSKSTTDLNEGTNLYYTESRVSNNTDVSLNTVLAHSHTNKSTLDNLIDTGSGTLFLTDDGSYKPTPGSTISTTDDLTEGTTNLYYTEIRVSNNVDVNNNSINRHLHTNKTTLDNLISNGAGTLFLADDGTYKIADVALSSTDDLNEGINNLYYTETRTTTNFNNNFPTAFDNSFSAKSTTDLIEGSNLYYNDGRVQNVIDNQTTGSTIKDVTSNYTVTIADLYSILECNGNLTITLPNNLVDGYEVVINNIGTGTITLNAATSLSGKGTQLIDQWSSCICYHKNSNNWRVYGDVV